VRPVELSFTNGNDLDEGFKRLIDASEVVYVFELSLDNAKPDDHYHFSESESGTGRHAVAGAPRLSDAQSGERQELEVRLPIRAIIALLRRCFSGYNPCRRSEAMVAGEQSLIQPLRGCVAGTHFRAKCHR